MSWNNFVYGLGDFFEWTFQLLPFLGNVSNVVISIIMVVLFVYWMGQMLKYRRAGNT